ncbi:HK97 family phage prohead protease [Weissella viridescens]|uniref:HK97 family phage prohead protease n=1 Tax=Weissella viridescens TaxID=1629 RepID=UPI003AF1FC16
MEIETRSLSFTDLDVRSAATGSPFIGQIAGYAIVFDKPSVDLGFIEYIRPEALKGVDLNNVLALYNHDYGNVLGRTNSDTLKLSVDKKGLHFVLNIPDTTIGHDVYTNIKAGNLQGMSFGFTVARGGDTMSKHNGKVIRTVTQIETLSEISVVSVPAYQDTAVQVTRSVEKHLNELNKDDSYRKKVRVVLSHYQEKGEGNDQT